MWWVEVTRQLQNVFNMVYLFFYQPFSQQSLSQDWKIISSHRATSPECCGAITSWIKHDMSICFLGHTTVCCLASCCWCCRLGYFLSHFFCIHFFFTLMLCYLFTLAFIPLSLYGLSDIQVFFQQRRINKRYCDKRRYDRKQIGLRDREGEEFIMQQNLCWKNVNIK